MVLESVVQAISAAVINKAVASVTKSLDAELRKSWVANLPSIKKYIRSSKKKYQQTKTILYRERPVDLESIYVGTRFTDPDMGGSSDQEELIDLLSNGQKLVVSATAGAGKSVFAKFAFLSLLSRHGRVPIIVELRHLNSSDLGILEYIGHELRSHGVRATNELVRKWIENGKFALILDGYDELSKGAISRVNNDLLDLDRHFEKSSILVTTRPNDEVEYFGDWPIYRVCKLNRFEATALVEKLTYDIEVKDSFLNELQSKLYKKHSDFLSNPLLLTIMLMTYGEIAEIPSKMHIYYEHAFDVLFYRHDAAKGMYRRKSFSELAIDDFKDILSAVSASGYVRSKNSYSNTELLKYIRRAKKIFGTKNLSPEDFKKDLLQSVCILVADGQRYTYNHRSFQEYFAAAFLVNVAIPDKPSLYDMYLDRGQGENALLLAFEMKQSIVEKEFISPNLERVLAHLGDDPLAILPSWFGTLSLRWVGSAKNGFPRYTVKGSTRDFGFVRFAQTAYKRIAGSQMPKFGRVLTKKSFVEYVGHNTARTQIDCKNLTAENAELLTKVGITEHVRKRIQFLRWLSSYLSEKEGYVADSEIEDWL